MHHFGLGSSSKVMYEHCVASFASHLPGACCSAGLCCHARHSIVTAIASQHESAPGPHCHALACSRGPGT